MGRNKRGGGRGSRILRGGNVWGKGGGGKREGWGGGEGRGGRGLVLLGRGGGRGWCGIWCGDWWWWFVFLRDL